MTKTTLELAPWRSYREPDQKEATWIATAERKLAAIAADEAKHTCAGTVAGAASCKRCLSRKAPNALGPAYSPQLVTDKTYRVLLAEYTGQVWNERAEETAAFERDLKRICTCGHRYTEHRSRDPKNVVDMSPWGSRGDCSGYGKGGYYGGDRCQCYKFHEAPLVVETVAQPVTETTPPSPATETVTETTPRRKTAACAAKRVTDKKAKRAGSKSAALVESTPKVISSGAPMTPAQRVKAFRDRARAKGLCAQCGQEKPRKGYALCDECIGGSNERTVNARLQKRMRTGKA
jgi:hypothetical protein